MEKILGYVLAILAAGLLAASYAVAEEQIEDYAEKVEEIAECGPIYVTLGPPPPVDFSAEIAKILEVNAELLIANLKSEVRLPDCYHIFAVTLGELGGVNAIAAAVERYPGEWSAERTLYVLLEDDNGNYHVRWQGGRLGGRFEGGIWGDSFSGIRIVDSMLTIHIFGGSSDRWGFDASYAIVDDELILYLLDEIQYSTHTGSGTRQTYHPATGIIETRSLFYFDLDNLLLGVRHTTPGQIFSFEEHPQQIWRLELYDEQIYPPMPSLYRVFFGYDTFDDTRLSAAEALGIVRDELFPHMEKMFMPHSQEIMDNFNAILGYEIPVHFFRDEEYMLAYVGKNDSIGVLRFNDPILHMIRLRAPDGQGRLFVVYDETGEISERP